MPHTLASYPQAIMASRVILTLAGILLSIAIGTSARIAGIKAEDLGQDTTQTSAFSGKTDRECKPGTMLDPIWCICLIVYLTSTVFAGIPRHQLTKSCNGLDYRTDKSVGLECATGSSTDFINDFGVLNSSKKSQGVTTCSSDLVCGRTMTVSQFSAKVNGQEAFTYKVHYNWRNLVTKLY